MERRGRKVAQKERTPVGEEMKSENPYSGSVCARCSSLESHEDVIAHTALVLLRKKRKLKWCLTLMKGFVL